MSKTASKTSFLLTKLHSISGVIPIGAFLLEHIWTNAHVIKSPESFDTAVAHIQDMPLLLGLEIFLIWIPILYHGLYGMFIVFTGKANALQHPHGRNWLYVMQRVTGMITFAFIIYHVITMRFPAEKVITYVQAQAHFQSWFVLSIYIVGVGAAIFHFANGLWNILIKWGITIGPKTQRMSGFLFTGFGFMLYAISLYSMYIFQLDLL